MYTRYIKLAKITQKMKMNSELNKEVDIEKKVHGWDAEQGKKGILS